MEIIASSIFGRSSFTFRLSRMISFTYQYAHCPSNRIYKRALGCGAVVLSILGLVGVFQAELAAIAVIGLGAILLFQGANVVLRYGELLYEAGASSKLHAAEISRGITAEFLA